MPFYAAIHFDSIILCTYITTLSQIYKIDASEDLWHCVPSVNLGLKLINVKQKVIVEKASDDWKGDS